MAQRLRSETTTRTPPRLRLAAIDGQIVLPSDHRPIAPLDQPEAPLEVAFEGISEAEQRAALAAFPGGQRFVLRDVT